MPKYGDIREDGYMYMGMTKQKSGNFTEAWLSPAAVQKRKGYNVKYFRKYNHGVDDSQFQKMMVAQNNACVLCGDSFEGMNSKNIHIDHKHSTGVVRAIVCGHCNKMIGHSRENKETLANTIIYLSL